MFNSLAAFVAMFLGARFWGQFLAKKFVTNSLAEKLAGVFGFFGRSRLLCVGACGVGRSSNSCSSTVPEAAAIAAALAAAVAAFAAAAVAASSAAAVAAAGAAVIALSETAAGATT